MAKEYRFLYSPRVCAKGEKPAQITSALVLSNFCVFALAGDRALLRECL